MERTLGIALIVVATFLVLTPFLRHGHPDAGKDFRKRILTAFCGLVVGVLVSWTSVGSGSLVMAFLIVLYPSLSMRQMVATDILHAVLLVSTAGLVHLEGGKLSWPLVGQLLLGSLPGIYLGIHLSSRISEQVLRPFIAVMLVWIGWRLI